MLTSARLAARLDRVASGEEVGALVEGEGEFMMQELSSDPAGRAEMLDRAISFVRVARPIRELKCNYLAE